MDIEYEKAKKKYSISYMSNAKWLKLLTAWAESEVEIQRSIWKFLDSKHEQQYSLPKRSDLLPNRFADGRFQPFEYKWILSIYIPRTYRPIANVEFERKQNVDALVTIAKELGQFPIFTNEHGIEVRGYEI